jgi:A/G-specific adenine glycosylase
MQSCVALRKGMVGLLPTPKPKKARPELYFLSLIVQDERGAVLLELQTDKGVWQGLWTTPFEACDSKAEVADLARVVTAWIEHYGLQAHRLEIEKQLQGLHDKPWLVHELTHRKMHFKVLHVKVPGAWSQCHRVSEKPVPKIVHKLLDQVKVLAQGSVPQQNTLDLV